MKKMTLKVTEGLSVRVLPNADYEFLMTTREVANGYGVSEYTLRRHKMEHSSELTEGKHFAIAVQIMNGDKRIPHNATLWTKRGIVRLGFFIKSDRAKLFRDWAEDLILKVDEQADLFGYVAREKPQGQLPGKRKHNRLTQDRLIDIMADVCRIEDGELRQRIVNKLIMIK
jgi:hypothetical protein